MRKTNKTKSLSDKNHTLRWRMNMAGDWEAIYRGKRYRAELVNQGLYSLSVKPYELSPDAEWLGYFTSLHLCEYEILHSAPSATNPQH